MAIIPKCRHDHPDCFAMTDEHKCLGLTSTDFKGRDCPFYKSEEQMRAENPEWFAKYKFINFSKRNSMEGD